jgi:hypothetical protein
MTEMLRMPMLLVEAFDILDENEAQRLRHKLERERHGS